MSTSSLYQRLGGTEGIRALVETIADRHLANPLIAKRYGPMAADPERKERVLQHLCDFLEAGSGGPAAYTGMDMVTAHVGMNINGEEYLSVMDDIMASLEEHGADEGTRQEVLSIAYGLKDQIMRQ